jgi:SAM-dependent methyltransferase
MVDSSCAKWFSDLKATLEAIYLAAEEPWKQSGFSGPEERWVVCRMPIADCVHASGTFLDIGCANGYLLECLMRWVGERGISIVPYGLDLSEKLVSLARKRLPEYADHIFAGNGLTWKPAQRFDYVRTELCYVPEELRERFVTRLSRDFLTEEGKLLIAEYRSRKDKQEQEWIDGYLKSMGFAVRYLRSALWEGKELTRIVVLTNQATSKRD